MLGEGESVLFKKVALGLSITLQGGPHAQGNTHQYIFLEREWTWSQMGREEGLNILHGIIKEKQDLP